MASKQPLAQRIVIAFTLMTLVVSGLFALGIVAIVHSVEEHLVSEELNHELNSVLSDVDAGLSPRLDADTRFFSSRSKIPEQFAHTRGGFTEVLNDDGAFYVYTRALDDERFLLVQEQQGFEAREQVLFDVVLAGFLLSVAVAWILGRLMARKVMAPVIGLAQQVQQGDGFDLNVPPLAPHYPNDEIGHLAAAFDSALGNLRNALERERLFTSDVSHELRTPLMSISTSCELLETAALSPRERNQVARIRRGADEMTELVETFLALARDNFNAAASRATATIADVAAEQSCRWGEAMREKGLKFELIEAGVDARLYHRTFLAVVMSNLLRNALHYTDTGSVRLILERGGFRLEDSGIGISPQQRDHLFEPFSRGDAARGEGLGLGLSLVKRICTQQGWAIDVSTLEPGGTCFRVVTSKSSKR